MKSLKKTFVRILESISVMRRLRKEFLSEDGLKNMKTLRISVVIATTILMITPWVFGKMVESAIKQDFLMTWVLLGVVIALVISRIFVSLVSNMSTERNHGDIHPVIDIVIDNTFSKKNIKQLRSHKALATGSINKARSHIATILIDLWPGMERSLTDLLISYIAVIAGSLYFGMPWIAFAVTVGLVLAVVLSAYLNTKVMSVAGPLDKEFREYNRDWEESIQKFSDFKAQGMDANLRKKNKENHVSIFAKDRNFWFWYVKQSQFREMYLTSFIVIIPYIIGVFQILGNVSSVPMIIALFSWGAIQVAALRQLAFFERDLNKRLPSIVSLFKAIDLEPLQVESGERRFPKNTKFDIVFDNVSHRFDDSNLVLSEIDFTIKFGEKWAFIGESGSGKTTLFNLILGAMPPTEGRILVRLETGEEIDLWDLDLNWWRSEIVGYVPQDVVLKDGTIRDNLLLSLPSLLPTPTDEELMHTLATFDAVFRVEDDKDVDFLDIEVGRDGGVELSGGQRQRIGIARAALKSARVVLFDEATSSLDAKMTNSVTRTFKRILGPSTTSIMIAHDLSTVAGGNPRRLLEGGKDDKVVCTHYMVMRPVMEVTITTPQIDYVGEWRGLSASSVMKSLIEESEQKVLN